jgi:hypothetical protein
MTFKFKTFAATRWLLACMLAAVQSGCGGGSGAGAAATTPQTPTVPSVPTVSILYRFGEHAQDGLQP